MSPRSKEQPTTEQLKATIELAIGTGTPEEILEMMENAEASGYQLNPAQSTLKKALESGQQE